MFTVSPIALEDGVNWRDPHTDLVHIVNYSDNSAMSWSIRARTEGGNRWMVCGHEVRVNREGHIDPSGEHRPFIIKPFLHTQDVPTCLACVVGIRWEFSAQGLAVDDEDDQDPLDRDGKA